MPHDHYIAQTYLKHFIDPKLKVLLHAYRKSDLKHFTPTTKDICAEESWDSSPYFQEPRAVDQYLRLIEPKWNRGVNDIVELLRYEEVKFFMAGYIVVMASCSPTAIKNATYTMAQIISSSASMITRQIQARPELFPEVKPLPQKTFERLMESGGITAMVDQKYSHAQMINNLVDLQWLFYKSPWIVVVNKTNNHFLTSDFPVAFYYTSSSSQFAYRYVPISPKYAILIKPSIDEKDRRFPKDEIDEFPSTTVDIADIKLEFVRTLNVLTVKEAENLVISSRDEHWTAKVVEEYRTGIFVRKLSAFQATRES